MLWNPKDGPKNKSDHRHGPGLPLPYLSPPVRQLTVEKGNDDVLALLYALASSPEDIEVLLISIAFGNVNVQKFVFVDPSAFLFMSCSLSL